MLLSICNRKGITLVEVLVSSVLISVGVMALLTLLPSGWRLSGTSDLLGRAAGILQGEMERNEILVMNINNAVPATPERKFVNGSGRDTAQPGDVRYLVRTERTGLGGSWRVRVWVYWPVDPSLVDPMQVNINNLKSIYESLTVTPQRSFAQR
jgi:hypothetical protein